MLSKTDLRSIEELFAERFSEIRELLCEDILKFKDEIITLLDKAMGELKAIREEQAVISGYKDQIEDRETRIEKIEEVLQPPQ